MSPSPGESFSRTIPPQVNLGWYKPSRLPHFDASNIYQLVTYRLADSLPKQKLDLLVQELKDIDTKQLDTERRKRIESHLDSGYGSCILKTPEYARIIIDSWKHFDGERYRLIAWTVMPNHVHLLFQQKENHRLAAIVSSWKKFSARKINVLSRDIQSPGRIKSPGRVDLEIDSPGLFQPSRASLFLRNIARDVLETDETYGVVS